MLKAYLKNPYRVFMLMGDRGLLNWLPDEPYVKLMYRANVGRKANLDDPQGYMEKMNWLKLYGNMRQYAPYSDKLAVRDYISQKIGAEYLVPLLGVWNSAAEIDFSALPERFVLKATHDSGSVKVCRNKASFDCRAARRYFARALRTRYYMKGRERQYEPITPRIIAETYLDDGKHTLPTDYKLYCFNGKPKLMMACTNRGTDKQVTASFFDLEWNEIPIYCPDFENTAETIERPYSFEKMKEIASVLCRDIPFVRIDFYDIQGKLYFGEMTFCDGGGYEGYGEGWEDIIGAWIHLPQNGRQT